MKMKKDNQNEKNGDVTVLMNVEYKPVPQWMCDIHPCLNRFEVSKSGAVKLRKNTRHVWSTVETCRDLGYMQCQAYYGEDGHRIGWWIAKSDEGYFLRPTNWRKENPHSKTGYMWSKRSQIPLHRIVASAWVPKPEGYDNVTFIDGNKYNVNAENLMWIKRGSSGNAVHMPKLEWDDRYNEMSVKDIYQECVAKGVKITLPTLYKYKEKYGVKTKKTTDDEILAMYDPNITQKKNIELMRAAGLNVNPAKLCILLKYKYKENQ